VFDCTGDKGSMESAMYLMTHGGKLIFVGLIKDAFSISDPDLHRRETTLLSSRNCNPHEHRRTIDLLESGRMDVKSWSSESIRPSEIAERFPRWLDGDRRIIKGSIDFS
jgi:threonine dehydrogenase-like Zn-dependent dehydrogenase